MSGSYDGLGPITDSDAMQQAYDNQFSNYESQQSSCDVGQAVQNFLAACGSVAGARVDLVQFGTDVTQLVQAIVAGGADAFALAAQLGAEATPLGRVVIDAIGLVNANVQVGEDKVIQPQIPATLDKIAAGLALVGLAVALVPEEAALGSLALAIGITVSEASLLLSLVAIIQGIVGAANDLQQDGQDAEQEAAQKNNNSHSSGDNVDFH